DDDPLRARDVSDLRDDAHGKVAGGEGDGIGRAGGGHHDAARRHPRGDLGAGGEVLDLDLEPLLAEEALGLGDDELRGELGVARGVDVDALLLGLRRPGDAEQAGGHHEPGHPPCRRRCPPPDAPPVSHDLISSPASAVASGPPIPRSASPGTPAAGPVRSASSSWISALRATNSGATSERGEASGTPTTALMRPGLDVITTTRSASRSDSSIAWVTNRMVFPVA